MAEKVRSILQKLKADSWGLHRVKGSHHQFVHPTKPGIVTVAYDQESDEVPAGTVNSIYKQAGWKKQ